VDTNKLVDDRDHLKVFQNADAAESWFTENNPEGVAFEYEVESNSVGVSRRTRRTSAQRWGAAWRLQTFTTALSADFGKDGTFNCEAHSLLLLPDNVRQSRSQRSPHD